MLMSSHSSSAYHQFHGAQSLQHQQLRQHEQQQHLLHQQQHQPPPPPPHQAPPHIQQQQQQQTPTLSVASSPIATSSSNSSALAGGSQLSATNCSWDCRSAGVPTSTRPAVSSSSTGCGESDAVHGSKGGGGECCAGCRRPIAERYMLRAVDRFWHEDCLKCSCCDCRLGEVGSTLFTKANLLLCRRDYLRLFGATGYCAACSKLIPAFEMVMKAKDNVYHLECFACQQCNHRFCIGDRYYLCDNKILCQFDYDERMTFARLSHNYNSLVTSQMNKQPPPVGASGPAVNSTVIGVNGPNSSVGRCSSPRLNV